MVAHILEPARSSWRRRSLALLGVAVLLSLAAVLARMTGCLAFADTSDPNVVFESDWSTDTGSSSRAVTDGGRWKHYWEFNNGTGVQLLSVVPGGPGGRNALRVLQRGPHFAAALQQDRVVPVSTDFYVRFYMRNDDTSSTGDHVVTVDIYKYGNLTFMRKWGVRDGWRFEVSLYGCGTTYPLAHWGPDLTLRLGAWYRFEYYIDFVDATHVQAHVRVFDASGTQIAGDGDFRQQAWGQALWNGRNDWTLHSYYAAGNSLCVEPDALRKFGMGNNGQKDADDTGLPWYFAGVQIRTDWWPQP
jgi:hypothetical protein